ncbi:MAG: T9SS type A sorting domain-containing protein [Balneolales bacterium]|nr:T9SS type A sorting domain-containing protein [Balneolales bacterium]
MKQVHIVVYVVFVFFSPGLAAAQGIISFSSGVVSGSSIQLAFSAGEPVSGNFSNSSFSLSSGGVGLIGPTSTSIDEGIENVPAAFRLSQNYPNPFNPSTKIAFELPETSNIRIDVFNSIGMRVATIDQGAKPAGQHTIEFNASSLASGMYVYRLIANGAVVSTKKMMLIK